MILCLYDLFLLIAYICVANLFVSIILNCLSDNVICGPFMACSGCYLISSLMFIFILKSFEIHFTFSVSALLIFDSFFKNLLIDGFNDKLTWKIEVISNSEISYLMKVFFCIWFYCHYFHLLMCFYGSVLKFCTILYIHFCFIMNVNNIMDRLLLKMIEIFYHLIQDNILFFN